MWGEDYFPSISAFARNKQKAPDGSLLLFRSYLGVSHATEHALLHDARAYQERTCDKVEPMV